MSIVVGAFKLLGHFLKMVPGTIKDMISGVYNYEDNKKWGRFSAACLLSLIITLVAGVVGIIVFHATGGEVENFWSSVKTMSFNQAIDVSFDKEAVEYMNRGALPTVILGLFVYQLVSAVSDCFSTRKKQSIIACVLLVVGAATGLIGLMPVSVIALLAAVVFAYFAFAGSEGGKKLIIAVSSLVFHVGIMPVIMLAAQNPLNGIQVIFYVIISVILITVVFGFLITMLGGSLAVGGGEDSGSSSSSFGSSSVGSSGSSSSSSYSRPEPRKSAPAPVEENYDAEIKAISERYCKAYKAITGSSPAWLDIKILKQPMKTRAYELWNATRNDIKARGLPLYKFPVYLR